MMAVYAIGDIQGCYDEFQKLLDHIHFDPAADILWFTGDLVNRGKNSLEVLRLIKQLGPQHHIVLGNHDLHLLAVAFGVAPLNPGDTFQSILAAKDCDELMEWLRYRPLLHYDQHLGYAMAHAGIPPFFNIQQAQSLASEVENALQSDSVGYYLQHMYGNKPDAWKSDLTGMERLRCITNFFTRMRLCYPDGRLDFSYKGPLAGKPAHLIPWFDLPGRVNPELKIIFGHWAALGGKADVPNVFPLDTGCVWGISLTAMRLGDEERLSISCKKH